ncbi:PTS cellbiose transporter subunit IIC [Streptococcus oralis]|nr:PTS cellbiose transporter subunit IIC [Streptococcus oralis]
MVCTRAISPDHQPAPKGAGFHVVQASLLLTRHCLLKRL